MRIRDIRLGIKQTLGFGFVIGIMAAVNVFLFGRVASLRAEIDELNAHRLPRILSILDLNVHIAELRTAQLQHSVVRDPALKHEQARQMVVLLDRIAESVARYERVRAAGGLPGRYTEREEALYRSFGEKWEQYQDLSFEIARYSLENEDTAAVGLIDGQGRQVYEGFSADLAGLVDLNTAEFLSAAEQARKAYQATLHILGLSLVGAVAVSLVVGLVLVRMVVRPVGELARAADRVAHGHLDVRLTRTGRDEIGRLTASFEQMTQALREGRDRNERQTAAISQANRELQDQVEQIRELSARNLEQERALRREAEKELQTAHRMQMALMPKERPSLEGFDIAGHCLPAYHVGGDFYQYFSLPDGRLGLCLADVSGHAMEAAIPVVLFSGILESEAERCRHASELMQRLNRTLYRILQPRTFVCLALAELLPAQRLLRLSNSGCPYPLHYLAADGQVREVELDAYPLGFRSDTEYRIQEVTLAPGDRVVLCSDGITEALSPQEELFGYERTADTVAAACREGGSAAEVISRVMAAVETHAGRPAPWDDQTIVVLGVD